MANKSIAIPMAQKALDKIVSVAADLKHREGELLNMNDLQNLCGWDADAKFAQARARMKTPEGMNVHHEVIFDEIGVPLHRFMEAKKR